MKTIPVGRFIQSGLWLQFAVCVGAVYGFPGVVDAVMTGGGAVFVQGKKCS